LRYLTNEKLSKVIIFFVEPLTSNDLDHSMGGSRHHSADNLAKG